MRKSVRGALYETCEHLGIQIPELGLVLRPKYAALGAALEALLHLLGIDAPEKLLECGASGAPGRGILRLELTKVAAYRLDGPCAGRCGGQKTDQCFIDAARKIQRRFRAVVGGRRDPEPIAEFVAALVQVHQPEHGLA